MVGGLSPAILLTVVRSGGQNPDTTPSAESVKSLVVSEGLVVIGSDIFDVDIELSLDVSNVIHQIYTDASARAVRVAVSIKTHAIRHSSNVLDTPITKACCFWYNGVDRDLVIWGCWTLAR